MLPHHRDDIRRDEIQLSHADRVENQPHAVVLLPEYQRVPHTGQTFDVVDDAKDGEIGQGKRVLLRIAGLQHHDREEVRGHLLDGDPLADHLRRELRFGQLLPILCLHLCDIDVGPDLKRQPDRQVTVIGARRVEIEEIINAGELQFDGARDRLRDHLGAGAGIVGFDLHHGRRDRRELRDRQGLHRHQAHHDDNDRQHRRKNRPIDEEGGTHRAPSGLAASAGLPSEEAGGVPSDEGRDAPAGAALCAAACTGFT